MHPGQALFYALMIAASGAMLAGANGIQTGAIPIPPEYAWVSALVAPLLMGIGHQFTKRIGGSSSQPPVG